MHVRRATSLAVPAFAVAALAASVLVSPAASAAPTAAVPRIDIPAPEAGTCWDYTYKQASMKGYTGSPVDCAEPHTVETVATLAVPKDIAAKGNSSRELVLWMDQRCQPAVNRYAGVAQPEIAAPGTRTWYLWYTPTARQWKAGAQWVSCAAASVPSDQKRGGTLIPVRGSIAGAAALSKPITFTTDYGRGTYTFRKPMTAIADRPFPGNRLQNRAASFCEEELGHRKFFWYGPSETDWVNGFTAVRCYSLKKS
jgi:hypothetical protein